MPKAKLLHFKRNKTYFILVIIFHITLISYVLRNQKQLSHLLDQKALLQQRPQAPRLIFTIRNNSKCCNNCNWSMTINLKGKIFQLNQNNFKPIHLTGRGKIFRL